jgi:hypothetical protein
MIFVQQAGTKLPQTPCLSTADSARNVFFFSVRFSRMFSNFGPYFKQKEAVLRRISKHAVAFLLVVQVDIPEKESGCCQVCQGIK